MDTTILREEMHARPEESKAAVVLVRMQRDMLLEVLRSGSPRYERTADLRGYVTVWRIDAIEAVEAAIAACD